MFKLLIAAAVALSFSQESSAYYYYKKECRSSSDAGVRILLEVENGQILSATWERAIRGRIVSRRNLGSLHFFSDGRLSYQGKAYRCEYVK